MTAAKKPKRELPMMRFSSRDEWEEWLRENHASSDGVWLRIARKGSGETSITSPQALEVALRHGWIDGQVKGLDETTWLQKYTPRGARSIWSKVNREKVTALIEAGKMHPAGIAEVERAKADGRWDAAYDPPSRITVPPDLRAALDAEPAAAAFFATLDSRNRYAILHRTHTAKKAETRAARIAKFVEMLKRRETIYP